MIKQLVLVHGAESFVGRRVTAALAASDWAEPLAIDTRDTAALRRDAVNVDAVARCVTGSAEIVRGGVTDLYDALKNAPRLPRAVHLSSMTVYGSAVGAVREDAELLADLGPYSCAQRDAEKIARCYENVVILRPGGEYGPDCVHWTRQIGRLLLAGRLRDFGANGGGCCNLLYIDDLVQAVLHALRVPDIGGQAFNLGVSNPPTWNEYFREFARALRAAPLRSNTPLRLQCETRLMAPILKGAEIALKSVGRSVALVPPAITSSMAAQWRQAIRLDVHRAEDVLGMRWTPVQAALERAAAWCRDSLRVRA